MSTSGAPVTAYVSVGSNIEPERNVEAALELLAGEVELAAVSTFYRTAPLGPPGRPEFLNGVCRVATDRELRRLKFDVLRGIERRLGRVRSADRFAPRTADLDVLLYGAAVVEEKGLCVPDPDIRTRPFLAVPLLELAPDLVLPDTGERVADLPAAHDRSGLRADADFTTRLRKRLFG